MIGIRDTSPALSYRADIDGLRAIAVLAVVLFHAFPETLPGGFIGVDIFFVISGYLISTIIFRELGNAHFSFSNFYSRRISRIFPSLILVLTATYAMGWGLLLPGEYKQLSFHIFAGAGFFSNFQLWSEIGYFDNTAYTKPLLHLWSLSIEEQFYLIWPLLICSIWKFRKAIPVLITALIAISFAWGLYNLQQDPGAAFYLPQSRIWELLCGAAVAWLETGRTPFNPPDKRANCFTALSLWLSSKPVKTGLACLAFLLILTACIEFGSTPSFHYPGVWAIIPVGTALCLITSGPNTTFHARFLANPVLVWLGKISYPFYLWHWPILSIARISNGGLPGSLARLELILVSLILAWMTYRFFESHIRFRQFRLKPHLLFLVMCTIGGIGFSTFQHAGLPERSVAELNGIILPGTDGAAQGLSQRGCGTHDLATFRLIAICEHDKRGPARYALVGDSKAGALYPGLVRTSLENGRWEILGGIGPFGSVIPLISNAPELASRQRPILAAVSTINQTPGISTVVIVSAMRNLFNMELHDDYVRDLAQSNFFDKAYEGLSNTIDQFVTAHKKVVIVIDNPALPETSDCIVRKSTWQEVNALINQDRKKCYISRTLFLNQTKIYRKLLQKVAAKFPGSVQIFDPTDIYCNRKADVCGPFLNGRRLYSDTDHISEYTAGLVGKELNRYLDSVSPRSSSVWYSVHHRPDEKADQTTTDSENGQP